MLCLHKDFTITHIYTKVLYALAKKFNPEKLTSPPGWQHAAIDKETFHVLACS